MEQKYGAPMDKVFTLLTDPKWLEARSLAVGELSASVKAKKKGGAVVLSMKRRVRRDLPGMLAKVSQTFSEAGINIAQANVRSTADRAVLSFEVAVQDLKQLTSVMKSLERVEGVHTVERV